MKYEFPKNFLWGVATSGPQTEGSPTVGGREPSVWDEYYKLMPNRFFNQVGPEVTSDVYKQFREDLKFIKMMGLPSYRTSIQWSRLLPYGATTPNLDAVRFYNELIDGLIEVGAEPFMNLHHFDLPWSIQEQGGWENRKTTDQYAFFAEMCFKLFGDRVKHWFTFNEPIVVPYSGYIHDSMYPNVVDFGRAMSVAYHTALAHAKAVDIFKKGNYQGKIGVILNISPAYPRSEHPEDLKAAHLADLFHNESFKQPCLKGVYPQELVDLLEQIGSPLPIQAEDKEILLKGKVDILGVNYYQPSRVKAKAHLVNPKAPITDGTFYDSYDMPGKKMNPHRGWEIYEKGIYDCLIDIRDNYNNLETFIAENGMGVEGEEKFRNAEGFIEDDYRIEFIQEHLKWVHRAMQEGCNCQGYHLWTFVDCWSWQNAYKNRYGYIEVQINNNCKRIMKKSGYWMADVIKNNGFESK
ncbi:MAG: glycoside hydrolase family 1 protein [Brevinema sp.]